MNTIKQKKSTSLRFDSALYEHIVKLAEKSNRSINNFVETTMANATNFNEPNEETIQALEEVKKEKNILKGYTDMDNLFADLAK